MRILWLSWKDNSHPQAGGAEVTKEELAKRLARDGHDVILLVGGFKGCVSHEKRDGYRIVRIGNRFTVYWYAYRYYKKYLQGKVDFVIDEVNTIPFFASFYVKEKNAVLIYQLARQVWFYQMFFPISLIGYLLEPLYLRLLIMRVTRNKRHAPIFITESESTKSDLVQLGVCADSVHIITMGITIPYLEKLNEKQNDIPILLSLGAVRAMKRTDHIVIAFECLKKSVSNARLVLAGDMSGSYGTKVLAHIKRSLYHKDINVLGRISPEEKLQCMREAHVIAVTSVREGWGLIVTEANSQGTPAVAYNVHGLRDSVRDGETGLITQENTPEALAKNIEEILKNKERYTRLRTQAWKWSKTITFDKGYEDLTQILNT